MFDAEDRPVHRRQPEYFFEREDFGANDFCHDGVTNEEAGEYNEEFVFFTEPSHAD
jgi:hypothetical protein